MLPPIRYPLPSLLALGLLGLTAWRGEAWTRSWRAEVATRMRRAVEGPPVPASPEPQVIAGPIIRRALLLDDATVATARPGGPVVETLDRRMFVDVYDVWSASGPPTHLRVGNRGKPIGWIKASAALEWNTRLVIRAAPGGVLNLQDSATSKTGQPVTVGAVPLPVLNWTEQGVEVAVWDQKRPWSTVSRRGWVAAAELAPEAWGVWISQVELPILLRLAVDGDPALVRLRAVLGRLADNRPWQPSDVETARPALPPIVFEAEGTPRAALEKLAEANSRTVSDGAWSGLSFRFLPLRDLP